MNMSMGYFPEVHDEVSWCSPIGGINCGIVALILTDPAGREVLVIKTPTGHTTTIPGSLEKLRKLDFSVDRRGGVAAMSVRG
jgi:hypothetical protein